MWTLDFKTGQLYRAWLEFECISSSTKPNYKIKQHRSKAIGGHQSLLYSFA